MQYVFYSMLVNKIKEIYLHDKLINNMGSSLGKPYYCVLKMTQIAS